MSARGDAPAVRIDHRFTVFVQLRMGRDVPQSGL